MNKPSKRRTYPVNRKKASQKAPTAKEAPEPPSPIRRPRTACRACGEEEAIPKADHGLCWVCQGNRIRAVDSSYLDIDRTHKDLVPDELKKHRGKGMVVRTRWTSRGSDFRS